MFQAIDVLNGIAWDEENQRLFGGLFALAVHCFHRIQYSQPFLIRAMIDFFSTCSDWKIVAKALRD
jgi:hypothetical protein